MDNYISLRDYPQKMKIKKGETVFISSDAKILLLDAIRNNSSKDLNDFIDGVIEAVGEDGTVIFPTYNWAFCKGKPFNYQTTPCETGSLGTIALSRSDFKRTRHPIYSFAVSGKDQDALVRLNNTDSFGIDSPFNYLKEVNATNFIIDVSLQSCFTFAHYVEEKSGAVKHRFIKDFVGEYIDDDGNVETRSYSMFVRDLDMDVVTKIDPIEEDFLKQGVANRLQINNSSILRIELGKAYQILLNDILYNESRKLCSFKGQRKLI